MKVRKEESQRCRFGARKEETQRCRLGWQVGLSINNLIAIENELNLHTIAHATVVINSSSTGMTVSPFFPVDETEKRNYR